MLLKRIKLFIKLFLFFGVVLVIISFINGYFSDRVANYVEQKAKLVASSYIEEALRNDVVPTIDIEELIQTNKVNDDQSTIYINTNQVNLIIANVNRTLQISLFSKDKFNNLNNLTLPLGIIFSETLFTNFGPNIGIDIFPVGSYTTDIVTDIDEYGINNSLLTINLLVKVNFQTVIPLNIRDVEVVSRIPIVVTVIQGKIPNYYYHNTNSEFIPSLVE